MKSSFPFLFFLFGAKKIPQMNPCPLRSSFQVHFHWVQRRGEKIVTVLGEGFLTFNGAKGRSEKKKKEKEKEEIENLLRKSQNRNRFFSFENYPLSLCFCFFFVSPRPLSRTRNQAWKGFLPPTLKHELLSLEDCLDFFPAKTVKKKKSLFLFLLLFFFSF